MNYLYKKIALMSALCTALIPAAQCVQEADPILDLGQQLYTITATIVASTPEKTAKELVTTLKNDPQAQDIFLKAQEAGIQQYRVFAKAHAIAQETEGEQTPCTKILITACKQDWHYWMDKVVHKAQPYFDKAKPYVPLVVGSALTVAVLGLGVRYVKRGSKPILIRETLPLHTPNHADAAGTPQNPTPTPTPAPASGGTSPQPQPAVNPTPDNTTRQPQPQPRVVSSTPPNRPVPPVPTHTPMPTPQNPASSIMTVPGVIPTLPPTDAPPALPAKLSQQQPLTHTLQQATMLPVDDVVLSNIPTQEQLNNDLTLARTSLTPSTPAPQPQSDSSVVAHPAPGQQNNLHVGSSLFEKRLDPQTPSATSATPATQPAPPNAGRALPQPIFRQNNDTQPKSSSTGARPVNRKFTRINNQWSTQKTVPATTLTPIQQSLEDLRTLREQNKATTDNIARLQAEDAAQTERRTREAAQARAEQPQPTSIPSSTPLPLMGFTPDAPTTPSAPTPPAAPTGSTPPPAPALIGFSLTQPNVNQQPATGLLRGVQIAKAQTPTAPSASVPPMGSRPQPTDTQISSGKTTKPLSREEQQVENSTKVTFAMYEKIHKAADTDVVARTVEKGQAELDMIEAQNPELLMRSMSEWLTRSQQLEKQNAEKPNDPTTQQAIVRHQEVGVKIEEQYQTLTQSRIGTQPTTSTSTPATSTTNEAPTAAPREKTQQEKLAEAAKQKSDSADFLQKLQNQRGLVASRILSESKNW